MLLEICVATVVQARQAVAHGAQRLELNSALELDGLTPSLGMLQEVRGITSLPLFVMLRPQPGGFTYDADAFRVMQRDAALALEHGADGLVLGILNHAREVDQERCRTMVRLAHPAPVVFHRAFDAAADPLAALESLIDLGFRRVLTSGQAATALAGAALLRQLRERACNRIEILPGGGIRAHNVHDVVEKTGCGQVHASLRYFDCAGAPNRE